MAVRFTIRFTGRVQGVGFRATTEMLAQGFDVAGWVRNEPDGSVLCIAEGEAEELNRFVQAVQERMGRYIGEAHIERGEARGDVQGFGVRF